MEEMDMGLFALHGNWVRADSIKKRIRFDVEEDEGRLPVVMQAFGEQMSKVSALEVFYGLVYVVIEGFRQMRCSDERVEKLLAEGEKVDLLRRFRNVVFHFQAETFDQRLLDFMTQENSGGWVLNVHAALGAFLEHKLPMKAGLERYAKMIADDPQKESQEAVYDRVLRLLRTEIDEKQKGAH
jgi:hypothetical protein